MGNCLTSTRTAREPRVDKGRRRIKLEDLPAVLPKFLFPVNFKGAEISEPFFSNLSLKDVLRVILSKLPAEEIVRTSVLSSEWRCLWTGCPKLSFNGRVMCRRGAEQDTQMFIHCVNAVLRQHRGKGVVGLEVKSLFENKLVDHLNNWISFAMFSHTKNLALDLAPPSKFMGCDDLYVLPFELFEKESASYLQCLQVSFICLEPPAQFSGFSNLRELELYVFNTTRKDLEDILCSCCNLEWLSIVRCYLQDELTVVQPLSHLQYLRIAHCNITKIEFHAAKLSTFVYNGPCIPIVLHNASKLENAQVQFSDTCFQQSVTTVLLNGTPEVERLTLQFEVERGKIQWTLGSPHMFYRLRHVQLLVTLFCQDNDKILYLLSFLRVAPVIEKLKVHERREYVVDVSYQPCFSGNLLNLSLSGCASVGVDLFEFEDLLGVWFANSESFRQEVPPCKYKHLRSMHVSGFRAGRGQVEFVTYVAENAPAIEAVTVDTAQRCRSVRLFPEKINPADRRAAVVS